MSELTPPTRTLKIPELCLVMLLGPSSSGKSQFARTHFAKTEVIALDDCRALICDDAFDPDVNAAAVDLVFAIATQRLAHGKLTVIDASHLHAHPRQRIMKLAKEQQVSVVVLVFETPLSICEQRNALRLTGQLDEQTFALQAQQFRQTQSRLHAEGYRQLHFLSDPAQKIKLIRKPLACNKKDVQGPFDMIGDIHGCCDELELLLSQLGYQPWQGSWKHPAGRQVIFVGDLVDRGPRNLDALILAREMVAAGQALCVKGNHEEKLERYLLGKKVKLNNGLEKTVAEIESLTDTEQTAFKTKALPFIQSLISHYVLDQGRLVVAHAGLKEQYQGRTTGKVKSFAMYGDTTGEIDSYGLPVRLDWAENYRGAALVVYGHVPVPESEFINHTLDIDTGCVFGGKLTALRYPEQEIVSVPAAQVYYEPKRPLQAPETESG